MASSSYYYRKYREARDEESYYNNRKDDVKKMLNNLRKDYERTSANGNMEKCRDKLIDGMVGSSVYKENAQNAYNSQKLKSYEVDYMLSTAYTKLENEYARLERCRSDAEDDKDSYYRKYKAALRAEREAANS